MHRHSKFMVFIPCFVDVKESQSRTHTQTDRQSNANFNNNMEENAKQKIQCYDLVINIPTRFRITSPTNRKIPFSCFSLDFCMFDSQLAVVQMRTQTHKHKHCRVYQKRSI